MPANATNHRNRMRRWGHAPLVTALAVGALCIGVGVGSATTTDAHPSSTAGETSNGSSDTQTDSTSNTWRLTNHSNAPVWGRVVKQQNASTSEINIPVDQSLQVNQSSNRATQWNSPFYNEYTSAELCWNHSWHTLPRGNYDKNTELELTGDQTWPLVLHMSVGGDERWENVHRTNKPC